MKIEKKRWAITFIPIFIIIIFIASIFYYTYEYDCKDDISCYESHLETCKKAKLTMDDKGSIFIYQISGSTGIKCEVKVTLEKLPLEAEYDTKILFEGKSMTCIIDKTLGFSNDILPSCTGPLKEAVYELTIQKMYNILAQSLGDIISKL